MASQQSIVELLQHTLAADRDLVAVYLFGSVAQGKAHAQSDIDVALLFPAQTAAATIFQHTLTIGAHLEAQLARPVDVVALNRAGPYLCFQVIKTGQVVLEWDRTARCLFHMRAMNAYYDAKPYLAYQRSAAIRRIQEKGLGHGYRGHRDALAEARRLRETLAATTADVAR